MRNEDDNVTGNKWAEWGAGGIPPPRLPRVHINIGILVDRCDKMTGWESLARAERAVCRVNSRENQRVWNQKECRGDGSLSVVLCDTEVWDNGKETQESRRGLWAVVSKNGRNTAHLFVGNDSTGGCRECIREIWHKHIAIKCEDCLATYAEQARVYSQVGRAEMMSLNWWLSSWRRSLTWASW